MRELLQQALDALRQCEFTSPPAQRPIVKDAITALREALAAPAPADMVMVPREPTPGMLRAAHDVFGNSLSRHCYAQMIAAAPAPAVPADDFCYCNAEISLQMVSGGAAPEGLYGRVTLLIDGKYVDYVRAESTAPAVRDTRIKVLEDALHFYANPGDYKAPFTGGMGILYYDCGEVARAALGDSAPTTPPPSPSPRS